MLFALISCGKLDKHQKPADNQSLSSPTFNPPWFHILRMDRSITKEETVSYRDLKLLKYDSNPPKHLSRMTGAFFFGHKALMIRDGRGRVDK